MMMIYPPGATGPYPTPQMPNSTLPNTPASSSVSFSSDSSKTVETAPSVPVQFGPNFIAPSYVPSYMYPYDPSYQSAYGPPKKRAKRPQQNNRHSGPNGSNRPPPSPGSDSAESSSSNTSAAATEKPVKPKKFHCEPCEKSFKTQELYEVHLTTHVACSHEGCNYSASKGALKMHELLHTHNMFAKLSTPEEIAAYRQERRKRFPSMAKQKEMEDAKEKEKAAKQAAMEKAQQQRLAQRAARAAAAAAAAESGPVVRNADDNADDGEPSAVSSKEDPNSDMIDDEIAPQRNNSRAKRKRPVCKYWRQGHCNKGEQCTFSHANEPEKPERSRPQNQRKSTPAAPSKPGPQTLLSQFLQSEISKEHKLILQCLRFIVQNDFFKSNISKPQHTSSSAPIDASTLHISTSDSLEQ